MTYFIRHSNHPKADLERGFSFVGYQLFSARETALETMAENTGAVEDDFDLDRYDEEYGHKIAQDNVSGLWGQRRSGLCAYTEYETLDEAINALQKGDYGAAAGGDFAAFAVIFEGTRTFDPDLDGLDDGCTFAPRQIVFISRLPGTVVPNPDTPKLIQNKSRAGK